MSSPPRDRPRPNAPAGTGHPESRATEEWTTVARVVGPHGRRGEVKAELLTDFPERFREGSRVWLEDGETRRPYEIESSAPHKGRLLLKLAGVDSISDADRLRGQKVQVPRGERRPLPAGQYYVSDLIGCAVREGEQRLGAVTDWEETGAVPLLRVESEAGEILIPFAAEICETVDLARREIRVRLPEGLAGLNLAGGRKAASRKTGRGSRSAHDD